MTWQMFGVPKGLLGRLGGIILRGRGKRMAARRALAHLEVGPGESVLEIGFGPGVGIKQAARRAGLSGFIAGIDPSEEMLKAALELNRASVEQGRVDLRRASVAHIPFTDARFDKAFTMYTVQLWPDTADGLREIQRTLRSGGQLLISGRTGKGLDADMLIAQLHAAGFRDATVRTRRGTLFFHATK
jgi:ubiquinone/menaquinone biosynthesis C-methylase UbiE